MRISTRTGHAAFLGYCANVHPGEGLDAVHRAVSHYAANVRKTLGEQSLALGLWISHRSLLELQARGSGELARALAEAGIFVVTLNGFPYGNFHAEVVKRSVYHPDLASSERREYLRGLGAVLAELLPPDAEEGTISTLPIGHRAEPSSSGPSAGRHVGKTANTVREAAAAQLCTLCEELAELRERTGKSIRICLEPEPGCWLETTDDALAFFADVVPRIAKQRGVTRELVSQHLGLCYDTCHQAIAFEEAGASIARLTRAGIRIGKAQLSSALELQKPHLPEQRAALSAFAEPRFLHQVRTRDAAGRIWGVDDLDQIGDLPEGAPWRVHFHVPVHRERFDPLATTRAFLQAALPPLAALTPAPHLEVETYTWHVLPRGERPLDDAALVQGLASELAFVRTSLA
jgi:hypothetical protein